MNSNYEIILKSFVEGCALSGIFAMSLPLNSVRHSFTSKSLWKPPKGHPSLEVFLSKIEKEIIAKNIQKKNFKGKQKIDYYYYSLGNIIKLLNFIVNL